MRIRLLILTMGLIIAGLSLGMALGADSTQIQPTYVAYQKGELTETVQ